MAGESGSVSVIDGVSGARRVLGVGEGRRAAGGVAGGVGGGGAEVGGLIARDRGRDPGTRELGGAAGRERRAGAGGGRVDPDGRAGLGRALDLGVVVVGRGIRVGVGQARGRRSRGVLRVGERRGAGGGVGRRVGRRDPEAGGLVAGDGGGDPARAVEGCGAPAAQHGTAAAGVAVDPDGRAGLCARALHLRVVVSRGRVRVGVGDRRRGGRIESSV